MAERGTVHTEQSPKRVRVMLDGEVVADSRRVLLVWEKPYYPTYYFPRSDVAAELIPEGRGRHSPALGESRTLTVAGSRRVEGGAYTYPDSPVDELTGHVAFPWRKMDRWFEEDEEVYVHARDPYKRVDILTGSRPVRIELNGVVVADSHRPTLLFETGLPVRHYLPRTDVRLELLESSEHRTECPYKGTAEYWSVVADGERHDDVVWSYPFPTTEATKIAGLMCFYDERVDVYLDGERQERPDTIFA